MSTTPAATIREAAKRIRDNAGSFGSRAAFWQVLASWLEGVGDDADAAEIAPHDTLDTTWCDEPGAVEAALDIARAYLADQEVTP